MDLDISIWALFKIALIAIGTYVLLPMFLVLRDYILWNIIDHFIITKSLIAKINAYAQFLVQWNNEFVGNISIDNEKGKTVYRVNDEVVSKEKFDQFRNERDQLQSAMNEAIWYIQRRSNLVGWLLQHYKQDSNNPVKTMHEAANLRAKGNYEQISR